jgi:CheY-like chemotaxis protein/anti-sigma regulatory factor (Ser/Thr protein kinase)
MDVSRIVTGKLRVERAPLDIGAMVVKCGDELMPAAATKGIRLEVRAASCGLMEADPERLQQVFSNLLTNALKFTPSGGHVLLACQREDGDAVVTVADTGEGIATEFLPHLFDRFTQADTTSTRRHGGLGIGLAIVKHLVDLHGGTVSASSAGRGQGATFRVRLPLLPDDRRKAVQTRYPVATGARLDGTDVLLVDDDDVALEAMAHALEASGARVRAAVSAKEAWDAYRARVPDVVVSDLSMPEEDGFSLLRRLRTASPDGRVVAVALTGFAGPETHARVLAAGFAAHVPKPVDPEVLVGVLVEAVAGGGVRTGEML